MQKDRDYVLDTSAIFCLKDNEEGASHVEKILLDAKNNKCIAYVSFMSMMEYLYVNIMKTGEKDGRLAYVQLTLLPIKIIESDEEIRYDAAKLKSSYSISVADAWIAALAIRTKSILVHKDPEFDAIKKIVDSIALPYKLKNS